MGRGKRCQKFQISQVAGSNVLPLLLPPLFVVSVLCHDLQGTQLFTRLPIEHTSDRWDQFHSELDLVL